MKPLFLIYESHIYLSNPVNDSNSRNHFRSEGLNLITVCGMCSWPKRSSRESGFNRGRDAWTTTPHSVINLCLCGLLTCGSKQQRYMNEFDGLDSPLVDWWCGWQAVVGIKDSHVTRTMIMPFIVRSIWIRWYYRLETKIRTKCTALSFGLREERNCEEWIRMWARAERRRQTGGYDGFNSTQIPYKILKAIKNSMKIQLSFCRMQVKRIQDPVSQACPFECSFPVFAINAPD